MNCPYARYYAGVWLGMGQCQGCVSEYHPGRIITVGSEKAHSVDQDTARRLCYTDYHVECDYHPRNARYRGW